VIKFEVFQLADLSYFLPWESRDGLSLNDSEDIYRNPNNYGYTVRLDSNILFIGGISIIREGIGELFLHRSKYVKDDTKTFCRLAQMMVSNSFEDFKLRRLHSITKDSIKSTGKFAKFLGFKKESKMKNYFEDSDASLYVMFPEAG